MDSEIITRCGGNSLRPRKHGTSALRVQHSALKGRSPEAECNKPVHHDRCPWQQPGTQRSNVAVQDPLVLAMLSFSLFLPLSTLVHISKQNLECLPGLTLQKLPHSEAGAPGLFSAGVSGMRVKCIACVPPGTEGCITWLLAQPCPHP